MLDKTTVYVLRDAVKNPAADKRHKYDARYVAVFPKGMRFRLVEWEESMADGVPPTKCRAIRVPPRIAGCDRGIIATSLGCYEAVFPLLLAAADEVKPTFRERMKALHLTDRDVLEFLAAEERVVLDETLLEAAAEWDRRRQEAADEADAQRAAAIEDHKAGEVTGS